jgi:hypothetical protein
MLQSRYNQFSLVMRQYRSLVMAKHFGCIHDPSLIRSTKPSACRQRCPACPWVGRNLTDDEVPEDQYENVCLSYEMLMINCREILLGMDANFRVRLRKNKTKRSDDDPELEPGWACMVEEEVYQKQTGHAGLDVSSMRTHLML